MIISLSFCFSTLYFQEIYFCFNILFLHFGQKLIGGARGRESGRKGGGRCTGGGRSGGGKQDSQGGGKREKKGKIMQHCAIFCNRKNARRREPGLKGTGRGRFKLPCSPPLYYYLFGPGFTNHSSFSRFVCGRFWSLFCRV